MLPNVVDQVFLERLGLSPSGVEYVLNAASSPPSRKVGVKRRRNLILEVPMQSIGVVLQAESLSGEYSFLLELDRNTDLKAAYDQPCAVTVEITDRSGRRTRTSYTPDYLVAYGSSICAVEIKADHALTELTRQRPIDWQLHEGVYLYLPAKRLFAEMGIDHIVLPTSTFNPIRADNLALLFGTRSSREWSRYRKLRRGILDLVRHEHTMLLSDILERIGDPDTTPVLQLIDSGQLFTDIDDTTLTDANSVWISVDDESHRHTKRSVTDLRAYLGSMELTSADVLDPRYEADVAIRLAIADGTTSNGRRGKPVSDRTMRRYRNAQHHNGGDPK